MNYKFWKFWTITVILLFSLITGQMFYNLFELIAEFDQTKISFLIIGIMIITNVIIGRYHLIKNYSRYEHETIRFFSESMITLGLAGTLIGFMIVLWSVFGSGMSIDPENAESMMNAIIAMAQGMSSALITSLIGVISSLIINLQITILEE